MSQYQQLRFHPNTGAPLDAGTYAEAYRKLQNPPWTYNPWTGKQRRYADVIADPVGLHIVVAPEETKAPAPAPQFKPPQDGWIKWEGGDCPVSPETLVRVRFRNGTETLAPSQAGPFWWGKDYADYDIVAYRVLTPPVTEKAFGPTKAERGTPDSGITWLAPKSERDFGWLTGGFTGVSEITPSSSCVITSGTGSPFSGAKFNAEERRKGDIPCYSTLEKLDAAESKRPCRRTGDKPWVPVARTTSKTITLPTEAKARKAIPVYSGFIKYFPLAIAAVAALSQKGNDQHNPGTPLHWDRSKSGDELDAQMRHVLDEASGTETDTDEVLHATKNAWRAMAHLQKKLEKA